MLNDLSPVLHFWKLLSLGTFVVPPVPRLKRRRGVSVLPQKVDGFLVSAWDAVHSAKKTQNNNNKKRYAQLNLY